MLARCRAVLRSFQSVNANAQRPNPMGEEIRSALSYARQRAGYGRAEIRVLDEAWNVVEMIGNEEARPLV